jgi:hypothetical protein
MAEARQTPGSVRACECSLSEHFDPVPADALHEDRCPANLVAPEDGTDDSWWEPTDQPVNGVILGIAHHHATLHPGGGSGDGGYECFTCDFHVTDDGIAPVGGWVRFLVSPSPSLETENTDA